MASAVPCRAGTLPADQVDDLREDHAGSHILIAANPLDRSVSGEPGRDPREQFEAVAFADEVSQLAARFVRDPSDVVKVQQQVKVRVLEVDRDRNRISLSMRQNPEKPARRAEPAGREASRSRPDDPDASRAKRSRPQPKDAQRPRPDAAPADTSLADALRRAGLR